MNRPILFGGLAVTGLMVLVFALSFGKDPHKVESPLIGRVAPSFELPVLPDVPGAESHTRVSIESLRGTPVILNFWATWCRPCVSEHGVLRDAARDTSDGVKFYGVAYEDTDENIRDFLKRAGSGYPTLVDEGGKAAIAYGLYGVPETFFIDAKGTIVAKHEGPMDPMTLAEYRRRLVAAR